MKNNSQLLMPREKMLKFGISALTDVELLALFLRTGTRGKDVLTLAKEMLENFGSLYGLLTSEYEQFSGVHGIGVAKFAQLKGIACKVYFWQPVLQCGIRIHIRSWLRAEPAVL